MRPSSPKWRLSPVLSKVLGAPKAGWIQGVRIDTLVLIGVPFDFSGEVSLAWRAWAAPKGFEVWTTSFCAAYCGYLSPDKYYLEVNPKDGRLDYETGLMSWFGPNAEAYFTALFQQIMAAMAPPQPQAASAP